MYYSLELLVSISQSTGVMLDPAYTLKATRGMLIEMETNPTRFKGKRALFLHTGMQEFFNDALKLYWLFTCLKCGAHSGVALIIIMMIIIIIWPLSYRVGGGWTMNKIFH